MLLISKMLLALVGRMVNWLGDVQKKLARGKVGPLEQQIEFVLGATKTGINILDPDLNVRYIDPDSQKMYGDPTGKKCYEYFKGRSSVCPDCGALKALKTNSIVVSEAVMPKDNNRPVQITSIPFKGQDGQQLLAEVHVDITERKQIEESLKAEKDKAQQYFEVAEVIMIALDIEQKVSMINRKGCEILGHSKEDIIGKCWCDNFVPDNITDIVKSVIAVGLKGQIGHVEYFENPVLTRKGDWKIIAWRNALLYDEKGQINGMLSSGLDITEQEHAKRALESLAKFPNESTSPVLRILNGGKIIYANESSRQLLDCWETKIGQSCPEDIKIKGSRTLESGASENYDVECGKSIISLSFVPILDFDYVNLYGRDVTFERMVEMDLKALNVSLGDTIDELTVSNLELLDFAHVVSHDLKSPVRAIGTLANWLEKDCIDKLDKESQEKMRLLVKRAKRLNVMIDGILQYCGVTRIGEEKQQIDLNELIGQISCDLNLPDKITLTIENELPHIVCRKARISQIFQNILGNAVKYMDKPEGLITVGCVEEKDYWQFSVSDNGPGIKEKYYAKIFELFETLHSCDETDQIGVGLSLVKKIVEMLEGQIWVESRVGHGSTFFFTIPKKFFPVVNDNKQVCNVR